LPRPGPHGGWNLTNLDVHLELWQQICDPPQDVRLIVAEWLMSRLEDPYEGMRHEDVNTDGQGHPNLWSGVVPGTHRDGTVVLVSVLVFEQIGTVRFESIMTLGWPI
jgi:hypothetical protein